MDRKSVSHRATESIAPLAAWDHEERDSPRHVWWAKYDSRYLVEIVRTAPRSRHGNLRVFDHLDRDRLVLNERVDVVGDPRFGPDIAELAAWQARVTAFVDSRSGR
jgi:hypothetical protein